MQRNLDVFLIVTAKSDNAVRLEQRLQRVVPPRYEGGRIHISSSPSWRSAGLGGSVVGIPSAGIAIGLVPVIILFVTVSRLLPDEQRCLGGL